MPLMNTIGNLTSAESVIVVLGMLVGAADKIRPREEKENAAKMIATAKRIGWETAMPMAKPTKIGTRDMADHAKVFGLKSAPFR